MQQVLGKARSRLGQYPCIANRGGPNRGAFFPGQRDLWHRSSPRDLLASASQHPPVLADRM